MSDAIGNARTKVGRTLGLLEGVAESGGVIEQLVQRDVRRLAIGEARTELWKPAAHRLVERQLALFCEGQDGGSDDGLGQRRVAEQGIGAHRLCRFAVGMAGGALVDRLAMLGYQHHGAD